MQDKKITNKTHSQLDFVNIPIDKDVKLFLDPTKLHSKNLSPIFKEASQKLHSFFLEAYRLYTEFGENEVRDIFQFSSECNFIHLGYSKSKSRGTGVSEKMLFDFFQKLTSFNTAERNILLHPASLAIFVPKFAEDRTSDFLVSLLKKEIVEYSLEQAKINQLEIEQSEYDFDHYWDCASLSWKKIKHFYIKVNSKPLLLIPKCLVSQKYKFSTSHFVKTIIFPNKRNLKKYQGINGYDKDNRPRPATQEQLIAHEIRSPYLNCPDKWKTYAMNQLLQNHNWYNEYFQNMNNFADNHIIPDDELDRLTNN
ncbi:UNVERIFIED_CONTAM: hypothetical protein KB574_09735 [Streptococcus canis]|uniref:Lmo0471 protein n=1 Tax=Streptococcus canis TaxID=1329 RepID=A0A3P5XQF3_STRCB|nr:hypothetical protein [Streptococcus canis]MDV5974056.1 hypothetical protein [Streptococcus canis]QKG77988.1 hypothetical protein GE021_007600 [Streptococcus canis]VDC42978.1 hypothetical protein FMV2238Y02_14570 [Streptococcus canis]